MTNFVTPEMIANMKSSMHLAKPFYRPKMSVSLGKSTIHLWVAERKLPGLIFTPLYSGGKLCMVAPVAPDLKMAFSIAKVIRDYSGDLVQYEALSAAPLAQGQAFLGLGAKYKYAYTALAVIFDEYKRTSTSAIQSALKRSAELASQKGCKGMIIPDFTSNIVPQPNWLQKTAAMKEAESTAASMMSGIAAIRDTMPVIHIWCWCEDYAPFYTRELERLKKAR